MYTRGKKVTKNKKKHLVSSERKEIAIRLFRELIDETDTFHELGDVLCMILYAVDEFCKKNLEPNFLDQVIDAYKTMEIERN